MATTSASLLDRLKQAPAHSPDWDRLHTLYSPLIKNWLDRTLHLNQDADDLAQNVLVVLVRELPRFQRQRDGSFRAWLRQITVNQSRAFFKTRKRRPLAGFGDEGQVLDALEDPKSDLSLQWDRDHDRHVSEKILQLVKIDFAPATWEAFHRFAMDGKPAAVVAEELGLTVNAVLLAKSRVMKRLRQEAGEMMS